ncbi:MAG TPA: hypothetical protein PKN80_05900 [bacterium]|nr:hypothetical protein [bacterium]
MTDIMLKFDVEDIYRPESEGGDDRIGWLAELLSEHGLRAQFLLIGDKYRRLIRNRRSDIARALEAHGVGTHTNSQFHPLLPERLESAGWERGVSLVLADERKAVEACRRFTGRDPSALSRHANLTTGAFHFEAARRLGLPYFYADIPGLSATASLCFCNEALLTAFGGSSLTYASVHDAVYDDEAHFAPRLEQVREFIDRAAADKIPFINIFLGHPATMRSHSGHMITYVHGGGRDRDPKRHLFGEDAPAIFGPEHEPVLKERFRQTCRMLAERKDVNYLTADQLAGRYNKKSDYIWDRNFDRYCRLVLAENDIPVFGEPYSPAELAANLARLLLVRKRTGRFPQRLEPVRGVLGPLEEPTMRPDPRFIDGKLFWRKVAELDRYIKERGRLPGNLEFGGGDRVGMGSFLEGMCKAYFGLRDAGAVGRVALSLTFPKYPSRPAAGMDEFFCRFHQDPIYRPDLSVENLARFNRLATWTLRLAYRN